MSDSAAPRMTPVAANERIDVIDILRGLALFGILAANMRGFSAPAQAYFNVDALFPGTADSIVQGIIDIFIQGKFITLFSFLFGLGFAVQMDRAEERGGSVSFYPRRLFILLVFGLIHSWFIWWGDILVGYAVTGFVLFLFRRANQRTILSWAVSLFSAPVIGLLGSLIYHLFWPESGKSNAGSDLHDRISQAILVYRDGSFGAMFRQRFWDWVSFASSIPFLVGMYTLPRFLTGLWVWRTGLVKNPEPFLPLIRRIWIWCLSLGLFCDSIWVVVDYGIRPDNPLLDTLSEIFHTLAPLPIAGFYATSVLLLCRSSVWRVRLKPFAAVGRMALTNYLMQSILCTWFFRITKLYGQAGPAFDVLPTFILFGLQVGFSAWWISRFQFGPMEWLWRYLTYGSRPPMRRVLQPATPMMAEV